MSRALKLTRFKKSSAAAAIAITAAIALYSVQTLSAFLKETHEESEILLSSSADVTNGPEMVSWLAESGWFGKEPPPMTATATATPQQAQYQLKGIFLNNDPILSFAVIAPAGGPQKNYHVNDTLPDGSVVLSIATGQVTLKSGDAQKIMTMQPSKKP